MDLSAIFTGVASRHLSSHLVYHFGQAFVPVAHFSEAGLVANFSVEDMFNAIVSSA